MCMFDNKSERDHEKAVRNERTKFFFLNFKDSNTNLIAHDIQRLIFEI